MPLPNVAWPDFVDILKVAKVSLLRAENAVTVYCAKALFGRNRRTFLWAMANKLNRFCRAKSLTALLIDIKREISGTEHRLQILFAQLALKSDAVALRVDQNMRRVVEEHVSPSERYCPGFNAPALPGKVHLDFKSRDTNGSFVAPKADPKSLVFISTSPRHVTVARGSSTCSGAYLPVHDVSGMTGVGKTTALIGLGHDDEIKEHFVDGVLYIRVGASATMGDVTSELSEIMRVTGATTSATAVLSSKALADPVSNAAIWFRGKRILFLIDDIWPSSNRPEGYLSELEGLIQGSPDSRIAISTRSLLIATKSGSHVDFGARDPCGPISLAIFMAHAEPGVHPRSCHLEVASGVLESCSGLPIALSVAGAAVALRINSGVGFQYACQTYFEKLSDEMAMQPGATFLDYAIRLSLCCSWRRM